MRIGVGDTTSDLLNTPEAQAGWAKVDAQLRSEGVQPNSAAYVLARQAYADSITTLSSAGANVLDAINGATGLAITGHTIQGAANLVSGLSQAFNGQQSAADSARLFTGTMIAAAVAFGAVSAGAGAAIIGAIGLISSVFDSIFGTSPCGSDLCGRHVSVTLTSAVGCLGVIGDITVRDPSSPLWRTFPDSSNPADAMWFKPGGPGGDWKGVTWVSIASDPLGGADAPRPIDVAFPEYKYLECTIANGFRDWPEVAEFNKVFVQAWKANKAFVLNGLKPQDDWQVLVQTLRLWNRSRTPGNPYWIIDFGRPADAQVSMPPGGPVTWPGCTAIDTSPTATTARVWTKFYWQLLVHDVFQYSKQVAQDAPDGDHTKLFIYTGPLKVNPNPISLPKSSSAGSAAQTSTAVTVAKGAAVVAGGGLLVAAVVAWAKGRTIGYVLDQAWSKTKGAARKLRK